MSYIKTPDFELAGYTESPEVLIKFIEFISVYYRRKDPTPSDVEFELTSLSESELESDFESEPESEPKAKPPSPKACTSTPSRLAKGKSGSKRFIAPDSMIIANRNGPSNTKSYL